MTSPLIYTDPYSGQEILLLPGEMPSGAAYDPRRTDPPIPWLAGCNHCLNDSRHLSIHLRRQIQLLSSREKGLPSTHDYHVPHCEYEIQHWVLKDGTQQAVVRLPGISTISVSQSPHDKLIMSGKIGSKIALRLLRFLFSGRVASPREILAVAEILADRQVADRSRRGYRTTCRKIDWVAVVDENRRLAS